MPTPCCPKCGHTSFEMQPLKIAKCQQPQVAVTCEKCGAIIAVEPQLDFVGMLAKLLRKSNISWP